METPMEKDLRKLRNFDSNPIDSSLYENLIGSLMYLVNTRPDICFDVNMLSQFRVEPRQEHWVVSKHILRYIHGKIMYGLRYSSNSEVKMHGFTNSYWEGSAEDRKKTFCLGSGYQIILCFSLGSAMISWTSRKHNYVTLNIVEVEYIVACDACTEEVWLYKLVFGLFDPVLDLNMIYCDNQSCVNILENPVFHDRSKNIEIKYYFLHDKVQKGEMVLQCISIDEKTEDILMKPLCKINFSYLRDKLGLMEIAPLIGREYMTSSVRREN
jgi:hypothetical protein